MKISKNSEIINMQKKLINHMRYNQPVNYKTTKLFQYFFMEKFGKIWKHPKVYQSGCGDEKKDEVYLAIEDFLANESRVIAITHEDLQFYNDRIPVLTLPALLDFVDENIDLKIYRMNRDGSLPNHCHVNIALHLKYFAMDNWSEPLKILEEIKKISNLKK